MYARISTLRSGRSGPVGPELKEQGLDVISLSLGEPDFNAPDVIKKAAIAAIPSIDR